MNKKKIILVITNSLIVYFTGILIKRQLNKYKFMKHFKERNVYNYVYQYDAIKPHIIKKCWFSGISIPTKSFLQDASGKKLLLIEECQGEKRGNRFREKQIKQSYVNSYQLQNKSLQNNSLTQSIIGCIVDNNFQLTFSDSLLSRILVKNDSTQEYEGFWDKLVNIIQGTVKVFRYKGIKFGYEQVVIGDFIYNPLTRVLRCYKPKFIGAKYELDYYIQEQKIAIAISLFALSISFLYFLKLLINALREKSPQQPINNGFQNLHAYKWEKQKSYKCHQCNTNYHDTIFLPCFHLIACQECSFNMQFCPACKIEIKDKVKIFFG